MTTVKTLTTTRQRVWVRADSAFATATTIAAVLRAGAWFSVTVPTWPTVTAAISRIAEHDWTPIRYPNAIWDDQTGEWICEAEVAETGFVAFTSHPKANQVACRLVVRRVKRLTPATAAGQDTLLDSWRYHAFITNTTLDAVEADRYHRGHAIVEQVIAELKNRPLAHLPSGRFAANAAWLACSVIAFNLSRAAALAAGMAGARMSTMLATIIATPARLASTARRLVMHLPDRWPWQDAWTSLWQAATGPPAPVTS